MQKVFYQAIHTKFVPPTNTKPSRIKASYAGGSITVSWDYGLEQSENHAAAAKKLQDKLNWSGSYVGGALPDGSMAFVKSGK